MRASAGPASGRVGAARRSSPDEHEEEEVDAEEPERERERGIGREKRERETRRGALTRKRRWTQRNQAPMAKTSPARTRPKVPACAESLTWAARGAR